MIVWQRGEEMMYDMRIRNMMMEYITDPEVTIDGGECTTEPIPFGGVVVGESEVGVLEEGDQDEVEVGDEIGDTIHVQLEDGDGQRMNRVNTRRDTHVHHIPCNMDASTRDTRAMFS